MSSAIDLIEAEKYIEAWKHCVIGDDSAAQAWLAKGLWSVARLLDVSGKLTEEIEAAQNKDWAAFATWLSSQERQGEIRRLTDLLPAGSPPPVVMETEEGLSLTWNRPWAIMEVTLLNGLGIDWSFYHRATSTWVAVCNSHIHNPGLLHYLRSAIDPTILPDDLAVG